jgi:hypothetical protein
MKKSPKISVGDSNELETPALDAKLQLASFIAKFSPGYCEAGRGGSSEDA